MEANPVSQVVRITFDDTKANVDRFKKALQEEHIEVLGEPRWIK